MPFPFLKRVSFLDKLLFTKHLAVMLKSGITLAEAVEILAEQSKSRAMKNVLFGIGADLANGQSLEIALDKFPEDFDPLYRSIVGIGEESGNLDSNFEYLASELSKSYEFKKKVQGAMLYPLIVLVVVSIVGVSIALFVLPQLADLFKSLNVSLPLSTRLLIFVAETMRRSGYLIVAATAGAIFALVIIVRIPVVKPLWHRLLLRLPIFGQFLQDTAIANMCRNLGVMLRSGLTITSTLRAASQGADNFVFRDYLKGLLLAVERGRTLESELTNGKYGFIPLIVPRMIGVGERTGKLDESLLYLGDFFSEEVDDMAKNLPTVLEPILLVIVALLVAFVAFSIITPIYQFTSSIHR